MLVFSGCKVNFGLTIKERLPDGYHLIESSFFPLSYPADTLVIRPRDDSKFKLKSDYNFNGKNILEKTWEEYCHYVRQYLGVEVVLYKRIPHGAGLGGGSGDAAVFLLWLNENSGIPLSEKELFCLGKTIGADIPFFLARKPAFVSGIGENLKFIKNWPKFYLVLVWPQIHVSTKEIFEEYDRLNREMHKGGLTKKFPEYKKKFIPDEEYLFNNLKNDLQETTVSLYPDLGLLEKELKKSGADCVAMSGSGSAFYGIFFNKATAAKAAEQLRKKYRFVFLNQVSASD